MSRYAQPKIGSPKERRRAFRLARLIVGALVLAGCVDTGPIYAPCGGSGPRDALVDRCASPSDGCYDIRITRDDGTEGRQAMCTRACTADADCGSDGACLVLVGDPESRPLCFARCDVAQDCFEGLRCTPTEAGPSGVCLP